ncbi:MAG TPA: class I SAM-dependent methyltransferase [Dehalococcoidia bacterium]|nr:class I SAM-dependent methyltransferase [Dehalococcoidia bacterium]
MIIETRAEEEIREVAIPDCPVCGSPSRLHLEVAAEVQLRSCGGCGLIFSEPLDLRERPESLFSRAYAGNEKRSYMEMFQHRLVWRADLLKSGPALKKVLPKTQREALAYIRHNAEPGSTVLDIGCGSGLFLQANKESGYRVAGIEVAEPAVAFLREHGYQVYHGTVEEAPEGWVEPSICSAFYVLHHVVDPLGFLQTISRKFPRAELILTEHYLGVNPTKIAPLNLPPRRLTIWNQESLRLALEKSGYEIVRMEIVPHSPYNPAVDGTLTKWYCQMRRFIPPPVRPRLIASYLKLQEKGSAFLRALFGNRSFLGQEHLFVIARPR